MAVYQSFTLKTGRMRFYSAAVTPAGVAATRYFFEVPFRGGVNAPVDRSRPAENPVLDRGRFDANAHYVSPPDDPIISPESFQCEFRLINQEPNYGKLLTLIRPLGGALYKNMGAGRVWYSTKGTTQLFNNDPLGQVLVTTPRFSDSEKHCVDVELLWYDPAAERNRGFKWAEMYLPPNQQIREAADGVMVTLNGEIYGAITPITDFTAGTES